MNKTIRRLDQAWDKMEGFAPNEYLYALRVAPSCPPSKALRVRGGRNNLRSNAGPIAFDDYEYRAYTVPNLTADLGDSSSVIPVMVWDTANYYQFCLLELMLPAVVEEPTASDWSFYLHGTGDEFETAGEAEAWLHSETFQFSSPWDQGAYGMAYPLCGLVLRNDGNVGAGSNILPIDAVNRGRSYIWPTDMRPLQLMNL